MKTIFPKLSISIMGYVMIAVLLILGWSGIVYAADGEPDKCVTCHAGQYQNYDNGKSFCLDDAPMRCIACHGGDAAATTKAAAHYDRSAHPVIGGDISRCNTCHLNEAADKAKTFNKVAGLSDIVIEPSTQRNQNFDAAFPDLDTPQPAPLSAGSIGIAIGLGITAIVIRKVRRF